MKQFTIMYKSNMITRKQYEILKQIEKQVLIQDQEAKERFLIHLAMVLVRIAKNEKVASPGEIVTMQIKTNPLYNEATYYLKTLFQKNKIVIPNSELVYLQMHVINFLKKR